jgi:hypothetical protein
MHLLLEINKSLSHVLIKTSITYRIIDFLFFTLIAERVPSWVDIHPSARRSLHC